MLILIGRLGTEKETATDVSPKTGARKTFEMRLRMPGTWLDPVLSGVGRWT
jgi:hypothetical protein